MHEIPMETIMPIDQPTTKSDVITLGRGSAEQTRALPLGSGRVALVNGLGTQILRVG